MGQHSWGCQVVSNNNCRQQIVKQHMARTKSDTLMSKQNKISPNKKYNRRKDHSCIMKDKPETGHFAACPVVETDKAASPKTTTEMHNEFSDIVMGSKGTFSLKVTDDTKPCQELKRWVAYTLQKPFKEELERL